ncbi:ParM/StbA family protein (plasmid) [Aneurinibacillus sp. Ricciae_BoGa-3]|uniref:ParM/StbA family protein n=1 Tax=Aneurinibacillus sp. Ricciae_BoGa-3 TaxID=3022697 RepID=UPI002341F893|nr:ParM/StbA family protein [Aneurinibacillus sp. Ricciae_BoGa-3]WCK57027.1 ParM/StbA family protein [Aneurinibacillus sp. Ricciae_BoGa-3]
MATSKSSTESLSKVVVDSGKFATKAVGRVDGEKKTLYFETKMDKTEESTTTADNCYVVRFDGQSHIIGRIASRNDFETTKAKELHKLSIYTAIHQLIDDNDNVDLVVGCPISVYTEMEMRKEYLEFIKGDGTIQLTVNGVTKTFKIVKINAFPESSGYVFKHMDEFLGNMIAVVDIGGLNTNCCQYEGLDMLPGTDFTYNLGANVLRTELKKTLNKKFGVNLSDKQVELAIKDREIKKDPERSKKLINQFLMEHVEKLMESMKENQWDVENLDFVFLGGGSLLLADEIKAIFGDEVIISENAVWDNAEGFAEMIDL